MEAETYLPRSSKLPRTRAFRRRRRRRKGRRCRRRRTRSGESTGDSRAALAIVGNQPDWRAAWLALDRLGVDVVAAVLARRARVEGCLVFVGQRAVAADGEALGSGSADVALELGGGRGEDAAAAVDVGDSWTFASVAI